MMDEEDRYSASSGDSERENDNDNDNENDGDDAMEDVDDGENDAEADDDNNDEDDEDDADDADQGDNPGAEADGQHTVNGSQPNGISADGASSQQDDAQRSASTPISTTAQAWRPRVRQEALTARLYDIVPTMAAPQATSVNALAMTPDLRYWFTGGSDGYIRKYDGAGTINGKLTLTVAQKHPFVDSVTKAGILMSYWENEEPITASRPGEHDQNLSPVYALAAQADGLWLLSGLESGGINLQSVRHDEGKKIYCLQRHTNAVSVLALAQDETSVLSGSWDKNIFDWDLNTGQVKRSFDGSGGQISAIELRPDCGDPVPAGADDPPPSTTISTNNAAPLANGNVSNENWGESTTLVGGNSAAAEVADSPAHESLFGGSDAGSLFGETAGEQPFGQDDDDAFNTESGMGMMGSGMDHSADLAMAGMDMGKEAASEMPHAETQLPKSDTMEIDEKGVAPIEAPAPPSSQPESSADQQLKQEDDSVQQLQQDQGHQENQQGQPDSMEQGDDKNFPQSPTYVSAAGNNTSQTSPHTFLSATMDGTIRIWDRRVPNPVTRVGNRTGVPPWCMSACWSPDGNMIYAGRRNGTVEEFDIRKAKRGWEPERVLRFPAGSGAVSAVKAMANGRHLVCASHDILRLYDLRDTKTNKQSAVPFFIIPGPPRAGVIASLYIDPTSRFMFSAAGTRGWEGTSTEVLIGYEIGCQNP